MKDFVDFLIDIVKFWIHATLNLPTCFPPVVFACLGFLSPANRGALMTCAVVLWVLLGTPAGYVAARYYKCKYAAEVWPLISDPPFIRAVCSSLDLISVRGAFYTNRQAYTPLLLFCFTCVLQLVQNTMRAYSSIYYDISCRSICWAVLTLFIWQTFNCPLWSSLSFSSLIRNWITMDIYKFTFNRYNSFFCPSTTSLDAQDCGKS